MPKGSFWQPTTKKTNACQAASRAWLDETGAPMKVQQELMRHASIQTTMNVYGAAMLQSKREANSKVVRLALPGAAQHETFGQSS